MAPEHKIKACYFAVEKSFSCYMWKINSSQIFYEFLEGTLVAF